MSEEDTKPTPHIGLITIQAIVNQQLPNNQYHPRAVYSDSFSIKLYGNSKEECMALLIERLGKLKDVV